MEAGPSDRVDGNRVHPIRVPGQTERFCRERSYELDGGGLQIRWEKRPTRENIFILKNNIRILFRK